MTMRPVLPSPPMCPPLQAALDACLGLVLRRPLRLNAEQAHLRCQRACSPRSTVDLYGIPSSFVRPLLPVRSSKN